jgi:spoIIIJ-associated protein
MSHPYGDLDDAVNRLTHLLQEIVERLALDATVDVSVQDGVLLGAVEGSDLGLLIGRHGQMIDAVQYIAQRIVFRAPSEIRIVVDVDGYRGRRELVLRKEADAAADRALRERRPISLEPMSSAERRSIHEYLRERGDVGTHSEGDEPERRLVVSPWDEDPADGVSRFS